MQCFRVNTIASIHQRCHYEHEIGRAPTAINKARMIYGVRINCLPHAGMQSGIQLHRHIDGFREQASYWNLETKTIEAWLGKDSFNKHIKPWQHTTYAAHHTLS